MLMPKRVKHRRVHRGRMKGIATKGNKIAYGRYGLEALEPAWITSNQIEAARIAMTRSIKRGGKVYIDIFPHKSVTKKPAEVRMGSGKGAPEYWVAVVKPGRILFEIDGVREGTAREAMRLAAHKLPIKTKFVVKEGIAEITEEEMAIFREMAAKEAAREEAREAAEAAAAAELAAEEGIEGAEGEDAASGAQAPEEESKDEGGEA